jgi:hypothetical protein
LYVKSIVAENRSDVYTEMWPLGIMANSTAEALSKLHLVLERFKKLPGAQKYTSWNVKVSQSEYPVSDPNDDIFSGPGCEECGSLGDVG